MSSCSASSTSPSRPTNLVRSGAAVDAHDRAVAFDVQVDVAVEVQQVQQLLQIVAGDLPLGDQPFFLIALAVAVGLALG